MQRSDIILGLHGLANKPPKEEKQRWWKAAIGEGLTRNCGAEPSDLPFEFVYWADLRYDTPLAEDRNLEPYYADAGTGPFPTSREEPGDEKKLGVTDWLYRKIEWLQDKTGLTPFDDALIEYRLDDLWGYLEDADFRKAARDRLREVVERHAGSRILLAAHSMGSLIAYDVLRMLERDGVALRVEHFVTLGAPLGLSDVRLKMQEEHGELRVPEGVRRWSNLMDRTDLATVGEDIGDAYGPNDRGVRADDIAVVNAYRRPKGDLNPHKSYGYLRTPAFSHAVHDFLNDAEGACAAEIAAAVG
ncbi:lipase family protein [Methylobacterium sp. WL9]|uniref:lipase/acyltransferase domain-containing protein n=1 Tax=Methylobacterium sp. WL9 TaxID=2603898 RepID=UPI0011CCAF8C|nr:lipase family protein [Methylobacterium sp. WL9]TXN21339.1 lipase family protein [Methylobacterium sp. WL9]